MPSQTVWLDEGIRLQNGEPTRTRDIPSLELESFREAVISGAKGGGRVVAFFAMPPRDGRSLMVAVLAISRERKVTVVSCEVSDSFPSLTPELPEVHLFEREIAEQWGIRPEGHPWLKPVRFARPLRPGPGVWQLETGEPPVIGVTDFYRVEGEEVHEVAVGPVHAGV